MESMTVPVVAAVKLKKKRRKPRSNPADPLGLSSLTPEALALLDSAGENAVFVPVPQQYRLTPEATSLRELTKGGRREQDGVRWAAMHVVPHPDTPEGMPHKSIVAEDALLDDMPNDFELAQLAIVTKANVPNPTVVYNDERVVDQEAWDSAFEDWARGASIRRATLFETALRGAGAKLRLSIASDAEKAIALDDLWDLAQYPTLHLRMIDICVDPVVAIARGDRGESLDLRTHALGLLVTLATQPGNAAALMRGGVVECAIDVLAALAARARQLEAHNEWAATVVFAMRRRVLALEDEARRKVAEAANARQRRADALKAEKEREERRRQRAADHARKRKEAEDRGLFYSSSDDEDGGSGGGDSGSASAAEADEERDKEPEWFFNSAERARRRFRAAGVAVGATFFWKPKDVSADGRGGAVDDGSNDGTRGLDEAGPAALSPGSPARAQRAARNDVDDDHGDDVVTLNNVSDDYSAKEWLVAELHERASALLSHIGRHGDNCRAFLVAGSCDSSDGDAGGIGGTPIRSPRGPGAALIAIRDAVVTARLLSEGGTAACGFAGASRRYFARIVRLREAEARGGVGGIFERQGAITLVRDADYAEDVEAELAKDIAEINKREAMGILSRSRQALAALLCTLVTQEPTVNQATARLLQGVPLVDAGSMDGSESGGPAMRAHERTVARTTGAQSGDRKRHAGRGVSVDDAGDVGGVDDDELDIGDEADARPPAQTLWGAFAWLDALVHALSHTHADRHDGDTSEADTLGSLIIALCAHPLGCKALASPVVLTTLLEAAVACGRSPSALLQELNVATAVSAMSSSSRTLGTVGPAYARVEESNSPFLNAGLGELHVGADSGDDEANVVRAKPHGVPGRRKAFHVLQGMERLSTAVATGLWAGFASLLSTESGVSRGRFVGDKRGMTDLLDDAILTLAGMAWCRDQDVAMRAAGALSHLASRYRSPSALDLQCDVAAVLPAADVVQLLGMWTIPEGRRGEVTGFARAYECGMSLMSQLLFDGDEDVSKSVASQNGVEIVRELAVKAMPPPELMGGGTDGEAGDADDGDHDAAASSGGGFSGRRRRSSTGRRSSEARARAAAVAAAREVAASAAGRSALPDGVAALMHLAYYVGLDSAPPAEKEATIAAATAVVDSVASGMAESAEAEMRRKRRERALQLGYEAVELCASWMRIHRPGLLPYSALTLYSLARDPALRSHAVDERCGELLVNWVAELSGGVAFLSDSVNARAVKTRSHRPMLRILEYTLGTLWLLVCPTPPDQLVLPEVYGDDARDLPGVGTQMSVLSPPTMLGSGSLARSAGSARSLLRGGSMRSLGSLAAGGSVAGIGHATAGYTSSLGRKDSVRAMGLIRLDSGGVGVAPPVADGSQSGTHSRVRGEGAAMGVTSRAGSVAASRRGSTGLVGQWLNVALGHAGPGSTGHGQGYAGSVRGGASRAQRRRQNGVTMAPTVPPVEVLMSVVRLPGGGADLDVSCHLALEVLCRMLARASKVSRDATRFVMSTDPTVIADIRDVATARHRPVSLRVLAGHVLYELRPNSDDGPEVASIVAAAWGELPIEAVMLSLAHYDEHLHLQAMALHVIAELSAREGPRGRLVELGAVRTLAVNLEEGLQRHIEKRLAADAGLAPSTAVTALGGVSMATPGTRTDRGAATTPSPVRGSAAARDGGIANEDLFMSANVLLEVCKALLNLSVLDECRPDIGKHCLDMIVFMLQQGKPVPHSVVRESFSVKHSQSVRDTGEVDSGNDDPWEDDGWVSRGTLLPTSIVTIARQLLSNVAKHKANRTRMYKAELSLNYVQSGGSTGEFLHETTAEGVAEGPATPGTARAPGPSPAGSAATRQSPGTQAADATSRAAVSIKYLDPHVEAASRASRLSRVVGKRVFRIEDTTPKHRFSDQRSDREDDDGFSRGIATAASGRRSRKMSKRSAKKRSAVADQPGASSTSAATPASPQKRRSAATSKYEKRLAEMKRLKAAKRRRELRQAVLKDPLLALLPRFPARVRTAVDQAVEAAQRDAPAPRSRGRGDVKRASVKTTMRRIMDQFERERRAFDVRATSAASKASGEGGSGPDDVVLGGLTRSLRQTGAGGTSVKKAFARLQQALNPKASTPLGISMNSSLARTISAKNLRAVADSRGVDEARIDSGSGTRGTEASGDGEAIGEDTPAAIGLQTDVGRRRFHQRAPAWEKAHLERAPKTVKQVFTATAGFGGVLPPTHPQYNPQEAEDGLVDAGVAKIGDAAAAEGSRHARRAMPATVLSVSSRQSVSRKRPTSARMSRRKRGAQSVKGKRQLLSSGVKVKPAWVTAGTNAPKGSNVGVAASALPRSTFAARMTQSSAKLWERAPADLDNTAAQRAAAVAAAAEKREALARSPRTIKHRTGLGPRPASAVPRLNTVRSTFSRMVPATPIATRHAASPTPGTMLDGASGGESLAPAVSGGETLPPHTPIRSGDRKLRLSVTFDATATAPAGQSRSLGAPLSGTRIVDKHGAVLLASPALLRRPRSFGGDAHDDDHVDEGVEKELYSHMPNGDDAGISVMAQQDAVVHVPGAQFCDGLYDANTRHKAVHKRPVAGDAGGRVGVNGGPDASDPEHDSSDSDAPHLHYTLPRHPLFEVRGSARRMAKLRPEPSTLRDLGQGSFPPPPKPLRHTKDDLPAAYAPVAPRLPEWCRHNGRFIGCEPPAIEPPFPRDYPCEFVVWRECPAPPTEPSTDDEIEFNLLDSVFAPRVKEAQSRDFYDHARVYDRMFSLDWDRVFAQSGFNRTLMRACKNSEAKVAELVAELEAAYDVISQTFDFFCCCNTVVESFSLLTNAFTEFVMHVGIADPNSDTTSQCKLSDVDRLFIQANYEEKVSAAQDATKKAENVANDDRALMRFEFLEILVRIAFAKFARNRDMDAVSKVRTLVRDYIIPTCTPLAHDRNSWRKERLYNRPVHSLYKRQLERIRELHSEYCSLKFGSSSKAERMTIDRWVIMLQDGQMFDETFTIREAKLIFSWSRMRHADELLKRDVANALSATDFLEALGRVADMKWLPTDDQLDDYEVEIFDFFKSGFDVDVRREMAERNELTPAGVSAGALGIASLQSAREEEAKLDADAASRAAAGGGAALGSPVRAAAAGVAGDVVLAPDDPPIRRPVEFVSICDDPGRPLRERLEKLLELLFANLEAFRLEKSNYKKDRGRDSEVPEQRRVRRGSKSSKASRDSAAAEGDADVRATSPTVAQRQGSSRRASVSSRRPSNASRRTSNASATVATLLSEGPAAGSGAGGSSTKKRRGSTASKASRRSSVASRSSKGRRPSTASRSSQSSRNGGRRTSKASVE